MTETTASDTPIAARAAAIDRLAGHLARYGLVVVIGWIGLMNSRRTRRTGSSRSSPTAR